ncbi:FAD-binding protein [Lysinibacillus xylanilyticus]|uniref:FAD-binding protein n=1 Tax=Lysinibacillus xylanilyticus TaxID=582475 RepID=A0A0K9F592_9BACI|nr:FAD-dependent monooxygenase [Lysinibacillus xylanilyticus]KMY29764.1 FAD-binding protein [Lysinibacillus xylanilyticus]
MKYQADVCIVGAGPGGALLSHLLAKKGLSVILLEQNAALGQAFRGEHLNEEGEAVLKSHQLFEVVETLGILRMGKLEYYADGRAIKTILPEDAVGHLGIHVPQANLLKGILQETQNFPHFSCFLNTKVTQLIVDSLGRYTGVIASRDGKTIEISSQLIIGADGRYSTIRKKAHIEIQKHKHGFDLLWAKIPAPLGWEPSIKMALIGDKQLSLFTQVGGFIQIGWNIEQGSFPQLRKKAFTPFIQQLSDQFPELSDTANEHIRSWQDFVVLDVFSSHCDCWGTKGLVLLGDAVHTMTPTGAFGLNSALKDAECLASLLNKDTLVHFNVEDFQQMREQAIEEVLAKQIEKEQTFAANFINKAS